MFASSRPRIAVTGPDRGGLFAWLFTRHVIDRSGGRAVRVTPAHRYETLQFDGLVIGGGADVDPDLYGQQVQLPRPERERSLLGWLTALVLYPLLFLVRRLFSTKHYQGLDRARDELEYGLLCEALKHGKPVLGICRGAQLINVNLDGTLHQDISDFYTESPRAWSILPRKTIHIQSGTLLREILQTESCRVNALHKQSINHVGDGLRVSAVEKNGIIQAIEGMNTDFLIGVQWHPEYLPHHARQQRLFSALVRHSAKHRGGATDCQEVRS
ncbi:MAG: gamma-glutamyl-gamma-aminobutyrate hydrolase family protein [Gammaproteobacteria bacterium]|nr:gamma-glutamyl-gamma-aminobutyrate hydrolase family protein [Gammaproteobacteria bacterium]